MDEQQENVLSDLSRRWVYREMGMISFRFTDQQLDDLLKDAEANGADAAEESFYGARRARYLAERSAARSPSEPQTNNSSTAVEHEDSRMAESHFYITDTALIDLLKDAEAKGAAAASRRFDELDVDRTPLELGTPTPVDSPRSQVNRERLDKTMRAYTVTLEFAVTLTTDDLANLRADLQRQLAESLADEGFIVTMGVGSTIFSATSKEPRVKSHHWLSAVEDLVRKQLAARIVAPPESFRLVRAELISVN